VAGAAFCPAFPDGLLFAPPKMFRLRDEVYHRQASMATNSIKLLTGNSHPELARLIAGRYVTSYSSSSRDVLNPAD